MNGQLEAVGRLMEHTGATWWIDSGTLLGLVRDGDLIPWDNDIDIGIWVWDSDKVHRVLERGAAEEKDHRYDHTTTDSEPLKHRLLPMRPDWQYKVNIAVHHMQGDWAVNQNYCFKENPFPERSFKWWLHGLYRTPTRMLVRKARNYTNDRGILARRWPFRLVYGPRPFRMPVRFFNEFTEISGFPAPAPVEEYLGYRYGPDWRTPKRDWLWHRDDGAVTEEQVRMQEARGP